MISIKLTVQRIQTFLNEGIWRVTEDEVSRPKYYLYHFLKVVVLSVQRFFEDRIVVKAAALTYSTLLSIVPILAIVFAIARGFGFANMMESQFRKGFEGQQVAIDTLLQLINSYLEHAKSGVFIGIGLIMLLWTVIILTSNIERTFNQIWQVKKPRSVFRKITDYFSIFLLLPILIVVSGGLSVFMATTFKDLEGFALMEPFLQILISLIPFTLTAFMFVGLYIFMPTPRVKFKNALLPGIAAGIAFQAVQYFYINSQIWLSSYNAIYGSFAVIPMFLLWAQISWSICLFGAELTYASQNIQNFSFDKDARNILRRYHDFLTILIMSQICNRLEHGGRPYSAEAIAQEYNIPLRMNNEILYELLDFKFLYAFTDDDKEAVPTFITVDDTYHFH